MWEFLIFYFQNTAFRAIDLVRTSALIAFRIYLLTVTPYALCAIKAQLMALRMHIAVVDTVSMGVFRQFPTKVLPENLYFSLSTSRTFWILKQRLQTFSMRA